MMVMMMLKINLMLFDGRYLSPGDAERGNRYGWERQASAVFNNKWGNFSRGSSLDILWGTSLEVL